MELSEIRSALEKTPFSPLEMTVSNGKKYPIEHPDFVHLLKAGMLILESNAGIVAMVDTDHIVSLEFSRKQPA